MEQRPAFSFNPGDHIHCGNSIYSQSIADDISKPALGNPIGCIDLYPAGLFPTLDYPKKNDEISTDSASFQYHCNDRNGFNSIRVICCGVIS
jgi:hypothetical protein